MDTLSRAYLSEVNSCEVAQECETVDHRLSLPVTNERWQQQFACANDPVLIIVQDSLVFKGHLLVVPAGDVKIAV